MNKYIGHDFQLFGVEEYVLSGGRQDGVKMLHVKNGLGLEMTICLSRGSDISSLTFKGVNCSYLTPNGISHPAYYDDKGSGWIKTFVGGFLATCGFNNVGTPSKDGDNEYPLHGCLHQIPVDSYSYSVEDEKIVIKTSLLDEYIFGRKLYRERTFEISRINNSFTVTDNITNRGDSDAPAMVLYHMNMGYPLLKEDSVVFIDSDDVKARNAHAQEGIKEWNKMEIPTPQYEEMCYFHHMKSSVGKAGIYSPSSNVGVMISYDSTKLTRFTEWKMMGVRDYVLGLEPGNVTPEGYGELIKRNEVPFIKPNKSICYCVKIDLTDNIETFDLFRK